jgi:hypothetical protein
MEKTEEIRKVSVVEVLDSDGERLTTEEIGLPKKRSFLLPVLTSLGMIALPVVIAFGAVFLFGIFALFFTIFVLLRLFGKRGPSKNGGFVKVFRF